MRFEIKPNFEMTPHTADLCVHAIAPPVRSHSLTEANNAFTCCGANDWQAVVVLLVSKSKKMFWLLIVLLAFLEDGAGGSNSGN